MNNQEIKNHIDQLEKQLKEKTDWGEQRISAKYHENEVKKMKDKMKKKEAKCMTHVVREKMGF